MALYGYMTLTGATQGLISAACSTQASMGNRYQSGHTDEIGVLTYDHHMTTQGTLAKATHTPFVITKYFDKSTPLLAQAFSNQEKLTLTIDFYRVSSFGGQDKFFSVSIDGGVISDILHGMPTALSPANAELHEHVSFRYREINWTHHIAGTSGYSAWAEVL